MSTQDETWERTIAMVRAGREAGESAGSWVIDGNTTRADALAILQGHEDGDPAIMDMMPAPLSGEWAGESMIELLGDGYTDEDADLFEEAYGEAYWETVLEAAMSVAVPEPTGTAGWCCTDCAMLIANGETPPDMGEDDTAAYLAMVGDDACTLGRELGALECSCFDWDTDTHRDYCEREEFSGTRCDVCHRPGQAGERHAVTFPDRANQYPAGDIPDALSYALVAVMDDGGTVCEGCVRNPSNPVHAGGDADGWRIDGWTHEGEIETWIACDHCGRVIVDPEED